MWRSQAEADGLTLVKADNKTGYFCVKLNQTSSTNPYVARVKRGGKSVHLGSFATAEEAALCIARSPEGQAAAKRPAAAPPLTSEEARQQAEAEGLTLLKADNKTGYFGVTLCKAERQAGRSKPYHAQVTRDGKRVHLGSFATAEEAALCIARSPEGQEAAKRAAAAPPLTSEEARQQAQAEGLTLLRADNKGGYFGVSVVYPGRPKPYQARVQRGGDRVSLGYFATAEEAALCVARSPEGREAAKKAEAAPPPAPPLTSEEARQQARAEGLTLLKADNTGGYFGVNHSHPGHPKPYKAQVKRGGTTVSLGSFATAEEAALYVARTPEGQAAAMRAAAAPPPAPPLTSEEARQQARAEGLTLLKADNTGGYFGVNHKHPGYPKPYKAQVRRGGTTVSLGSFATAEEAALCVARTPEGQAAAMRAAVAPLTSEEVGRRGARSLKRKELLGRWEQVLTAVGARSIEAAEEEAEEVEMELVEVVEVVGADEAEEADVVVVEAEVVEAEVVEAEVVEAEGAGEAEDSQIAPVRGDGGGGCDG